MNKKISITGAVILLSIKAIIGQTVGKDKDAHGCRASAGYTFSVIKNDCVRLFEQEIQLNEINPTGTSTSFSAVIFSSDNKKAEVFIPGTTGGVILTRKGKAGSYIWENAKISLSQKDKGYILKKANKAIYSLEVSAGS